MKHRLLTFTFLLLSFQAAHAQLSDQKRHFIALNVGASIPLGVYNNTSMDEDNAGYATAGGDFNFEGAYYFKPYLGIGGTLGIFSNKINKEEFEHDLNDDLESSGLQGSYYGTVGSWRTLYVMVGPYLSVPLNKFTFDLKLMAGPTNTASPEIDITVNPDNTPDQIRFFRESDQGTSFAYNIGVAARYHFNKRWAIRAHADFISANPHFDQKTHVYYQGVKNSGTNSYDQPISVLNTGVGIVLQLGK